MIRLLLLLILTFSISISGVAAMKATIVFMGQIVYGGTYAWTLDDIRDVSVKGFVLGLGFSIFAIANDRKA
jgi:hypothetical protein